MSDGCPEGREVLASAREGLSPRKAILAIQEKYGDDIPAGTMEAFVDYLRDKISALDLTLRPAKSTVDASI